MHLFGLLRDRSAGVAPLVALAAVPLIASLGAAIDYSRVNALRTSMQNALDAAALLLSQQAQQLSGDQLTQDASTYFNGNFVHPQVQNLQVTAATSSQSGGSSVSMTAAGSVTTLFLGLVGISTIHVSAQSSAYASADGLGCVLSLDKTASGAVTAQGNTTVNLNGCSLYDNSNSPSALSVGGSAALAALSVGVVGGISGSSGITVTQGIRTGVGAVS